MDKRIAEIMIEAMDAEGHEARLFKDYSGRGMYGETTTGIVIDNETLLIQSVINQADKFVGIKVNIEGLRTDNMGLSIILY